MQYTDGKGTYQLPKLTLALEERFESARKERHRRKAIEAKLGLMVECLGAEYVRNRCESDKADEVDICELNALFIDVSMAYNMYGVGEVASALSQVTPLVEQMERISAITNGRQGFRMVK